MQVKITDVQDKLVRVILNRSGLSEDEAMILANSYLEGELEGKKSHGVAAFLAAVDTLPEARATYTVIKETDAFIYADAEGNFGSIVGRKLVDLAVEKAQKQGVALVLIREMKTWLRPAELAKYIADNNMVAWVVNTGGLPMVAPPGGKEPVVGTNPIGIGIPSDDSPVVVDMATSTRAWGEVRMAKRFGHALPENSFIDEEGVPTLDPDLAHAAIPMGGYKGFGLGLFIEILGGSLVGMNMGKGDPNEAYHARNRGAFILVVNPDMTVGSDTFKQTNAEFIETIRRSPAAKDSEGITLPGDRATKNKQTNIERGYLELDDKLWAEIMALLQ